MKGEKFSLIKKGKFERDKEKGRNMYGQGDECKDRIITIWLAHNSPSGTKHMSLYVRRDMEVFQVLICSWWFTFVIAFLLLLTGAALNDQHGEESMYFGSYYCYVVKPGVFAGGAVLSLASVALGILYYLTLNSVKNNNSNLWGNSSGPHEGGIAMGQPQFPPPASQDPVFVHEDTYMRRQQIT
ncbi:hypothetical protein Pint_21477 [Pistacia integerrima]|uniref:Uncharacterized protein n=1 Tax=Pistacia integerrima TaxID=434235 RepID=A0ACC0XAV1_9ROSI|nr:hypothetical protein Pint_21477 [Pistacia integerrima]